MKRILTILTIFIGCGIASAQEFEETLVVYYRAGSAWFLPQLNDNGVRTTEFFKNLDNLRSMPGVTISSVELIGSCSPDGTQEYNDFLGNRRTMLFYERFSKELNYPINKITFRNMSEDWETIARCTAQDRDIALRREAVRIINSGEPGIIERLQALDYGNTYQKIFDNIFPEVRTTTLRVTFDVVDRDKEVVVEEEVVEEEIDKISFPPVVRKKVRTPRVREAASGQMAFNLKLNAAGWLLGVPNVAMECSVAPNLSINLPIYYSGVNMNLYTFDFKGLILQPELRFYVPNTYGFYVGAHAGIAWYNCHRGGDYRYQNSGWDRPTYGGGLNIGYQLPLKKGSGWKVEFGFGAGIYDAKYDIFYNEENGPYVARDQYRLYYGFDQGHISFLYSFDFRRKEGRR